MAFRLEISTRPDLINAEGASILKRIRNELDIPLESVNVVSVFTIDADLSPEKLTKLKELIFTDPISEMSSYEKLPSKEGFDVLIEVGWKPGLTDNAARVAQEAFRDIGITLGLKDKISSSIQYRIKGVEGADFEQEKIASRLLANPLVQRWYISNYSHWSDVGVPHTLARASINNPPVIEYIDLAAEPEELLNLSDSSQWGLSRQELQAIVEYYDREGVARRRVGVGLQKIPTDAEMESLAQTWSEHCKHKQFNAIIHFRGANGERCDIDSLFDTYIKGATKKIMETRPWIKSVFWDNAGVMEFNKDWLFCLKCETHNSPSNMEGYGGAITGIVGVYRDPMGTGMGAKIVFGYYGFMVGPQDFHGRLSPPQHPRVLLERVRKGVEDGGNKHGVPTPYGRVFFDESYLGKCIILVAAGGMIPSRVNGKPGWEKRVEPGDLIVMAGGRIGVDGIHGATASSRPFDDTTPAGHVQIGDPYMQKKLMDMLLEARDEGLYNFVQDNGAGGLNSSVGETAGFCGKKGGCVLHLDRAPLKYPNLNPWEILVSESQERMTFAVPPKKISLFQRLARKHDVEVTVLGEFVDSGTFHVKYGGESVVYLDMEFLHEGVPQMELNAREEKRNIFPVPKLGEDKKYTRVLIKMLSRPNICSREYIIRQFDHEVQGGSVIKPLVGARSDVESDSVVIRPVLDSMEGLAISSGLNPHYSKISAYHMSAMAIDEAIRRIIAVGGSLDRMILNDNFNWPLPLNDADLLAQLVRANQALYDYTVSFGTPCISGKDSMSIDGFIKDREGRSKKISGLPMVQYLAVGKIEDVRKCVTMDVKKAGDIVYVVGITRDELGASEYFDMMGAVGNNVPKVDGEKAKIIYTGLNKAVEEGLVASMHGCYKGGLGVALAQTAFAGDLGMEVDLRSVPTTGVSRNDGVLFSESASRLVVTVAPHLRGRFEELLTDARYSCIGKVLESSEFKVIGIDGNVIIRSDITVLKEAWQSPMRY